MKHATMSSGCSGRRIAREISGGPADLAVGKVESPVRYFFSVTLPGACRRLFARRNPQPVLLPVAATAPAATPLERQGQTNERPSCDAMMLQALFQVLADYVETERIALVGLDARSALSVRNEVLELYIWWTRLRPQRDLEFQHMPDLARALMLEPGEAQPTGHRWQSVQTEVRRMMQRKWRDEDHQMLMRLIQIRPYLGG